jgi:hypothetical protein
MKTEIWIVYRLFDYEDDFKWKSFELHLVESYNFHIKFTSIQVQIKKLHNFENTPTAVGHGRSSRYSTPARGLSWATTVDV